MGLTNWFTSGIQANSRGTRGTCAPTCEVWRTLANLYGHVHQNPPPPIFTRVPVKVPSAYGGPLECAQATLIGPLFAMVR